MADPSRLPHLNRPSYQSTPQTDLPPSPAPRPPVLEQKILTENLPRPLLRHDTPPISYKTNIHPPPPIDSLFTTKEQSSSNPHFLRLTLNTIPIESSQCINLGIPVGAIWHPLAELPPEDDQVQKTLSSPFRCTKCMAYINSFFKFIEGNQKCICNICGMVLNTPDIYLRDGLEKVELYAGTYDFKAPAEYSNRPCQPFFYIFCVDVSGVGLEMRIFQQVVVSIQAILDSLPYPERTFIGIIAFDNAIRVFRVSAYSGELIETVMNDAEDPFISESTSGCCYNLGKQRDIIEGLLEKLANWEFLGSSKNVFTVGAVVNAVKQYLLKGVGGRVLLFTSQPGSGGKYALNSAPDIKFNHSEKEKGYLPSEVYTLLSQECIEDDICIDIFACTQSASMNSSSLSALCSQTGGDFYYFPGYNPETDAEKIYYLIVRILTRPQCSQVIMRTRCCNGLSVDYYIGKYKRRGPVEMQAACIDSDKSIGIVLKYDERLNDGSEYYIQCAMLYTSIQGERLIRINNMRMIASKNVGSIYKSTDIDAINSLMLKISSNSLFEEPLNTIRDTWHANIIKVLVNHRNSIGNMDFNKILVPETLRLMPLYCNASLKLPGLTLQNVSNDLRISSIHQILSMPILQTRLLIYPKIYQIHDIFEQTHQPGTLNDHKQVILPKLIGCSIEFFSSDSIYFLTNGLIILIFIGKDVNPVLINQIWSLEDLQTLISNPECHQIYNTDSEIGQKFSLILNELKLRTPGSYPPTLLYFESHSNPSLLKPFLSEDSNSSDFSYSDFLIRLHKVVINKLKN
jgi:protein transport protein SEC24